MADDLRAVYRDRWVRFHSLPESKRYPETDAEYAIALDRYNTVLDELFAGQEVHVVTADWSNTESLPPRSPDHAGRHPGSRHWVSFYSDPDPDPEFQRYTHLYASRIPWRRGCVDELLRSVADDVAGGVFITDLALRRIHHPYDGGADVILTTTAERDELKARHTSWLSKHPLGL